MASNSLYVQFEEKEAEKKLGTAKLREPNHTFRVYTVHTLY